MITSLQIGTGGLGRFGNMAFTIAGVIGIAIRSGQPYAFPRWVTHDNKIFGEEPDDIEQYLVNELPRIPDGLQFNQYGYFWGYRDIHLPTGNWSIDAHMQSYKFFLHCIDKVREVFRFKDEPEQNEFTAIHFRAGDYIDDPDAQHPRCSKEYYEKAMNIVSDNGMLPIKYAIFTDDYYAWRKMFPDFAGFEVGDKMINGSYINDFKFMKRCHSFICANSSFSFMAALLGEHPDKKIIMPFRWFGSQMPPEFDTKDIYPQEAIVI